MTLPDTWTTRPLRELVNEVRVSVTPDKHTEYELWSVPSWSSNTPEILRGGSIGSAKRRVKPGDVLLCKINPRINRVWHVREQHGLEQIASPEWLILRERPDVPDLHMPYLRIFLGSPKFRDWIVTATSGVTGSHTRAKADDILRQLVPLPPLGEQRRIVAVLEEHLSRLEAGQQALSAARLKARAWTHGLADEAIYGRAHPLRSVGDLLREGLRNGHSAPAAGAGRGGLRTLTLTSVTRSEFSDRYTKLTSADPSKVADLWLKAGDILVQRSNTPDLVGSAALYSGPDDWAIFPDLMIRLRCDLAEVSPQYLVAALRAERTHRVLRAKAKGLAGSMPKIDQAAIASLQVPVPASAVDRERVAAEVAEAEATRLRLDAAADLNARRGLLLSRALLSSAFSGHLTSRTNIDDLMEMSGV